MKSLVVTLALILSSSQLMAQTELSLSAYQDMDCYSFIKAETQDEFVKFARNEITSMIEADYCELRAAGYNEKDFLGSEAEREGISDAAHSKLIEALFVEFQGL